MRTAFTVLGIAIYLQNLSRKKKKTSASKKSQKQMFTNRFQAENFKDKEGNNYSHKRLPYSNLIGKVMYN